MRKGPREVSSGGSLGLRLVVLVFLVTVFRGGRGDRSGGGRRRHKLAPGVTGPLPLRADDSLENVGERRLPGRKIEIAQAKKDQDHLQAKCPIRVVAVGEQRRFLMSGASSEAVNGSMAPTSKKQRRQATSWRCRNRKKRMPESRGALARLITLRNTCCV